LMRKVIQYSSSCMDKEEAALRAILIFKNHHSLLNLVYHITY
jgi:hypothetical protein